MVAVVVAVEVGGGSGGRGGWRRWWWWCWCAWIRAVGSGASKQVHTRTLNAAITGADSSSISLWVFMWCCRSMYVARATLKSTCVVVAVVVVVVVAVVSGLVCLDTGGW